MKPILAILLLSTLPALAGPPVPKWRSACPDCGTTNISTTVLSTGGYVSTNGTYQTRSVQFKCKSCKTMYSAKLPDKLIKQPVAERVLETVSPPPVPTPARSPKVEAMKPMSDIGPIQPMLWMYVGVADTEIPLVDYASITQLGTVPSTGLTNPFNVYCYSGPIWTLANIGSNTLYIERSTNLLNWVPWPGSGFQMTLPPLTDITGALEPDREFYRARL